MYWLRAEGNEYIETMWQKIQLRPKLNLSAKSLRVQLVCIVDGHCNGLYQLLPFQLLHLLLYATNERYSIIANTYGLCAMKNGGVYTVDI